MTHSRSGEPSEAGDHARPLPWGSDAPVEEAPSGAPPPREFDPRFGEPGIRWRGDGALPAVAQPRETAPHPIDRPDLRPFEGVQAPGDHPGIAGRAYATFWRRFAAWWIDFLIRVMLLWIVLAVTGIEPPENPFALSGPLFGTMQSLNLMYGWIFTVHGWTPGQRILHMRMVRADGVTAPGPWWAILRTLGAFLSELAFFIGYLWMLRDPHHQTWHDKMARTYVVMAREADYDRPR